MIVELKEISKYYNNKSILDKIDLKIGEGQKVGILGKTGSGKTTLLNIISTIDRKYTGEFKLFDKKIDYLNNNDLAILRKEKLGFIFQDFGLLENLTAKENIILPSRIAGLKIIFDDYYKMMISTLGIEGILEQYPSELSGGEKQRVSIARAMIKKPKLLIADEITSSLDPYTAKEIVAYLNDIITIFNTTLILVTHDWDTIDICDLIYLLDDKKIFTFKNIREIDNYYKNIIKCD